MTQSTKDAKSFDTFENGVKNRNQTSGTAALNNSDECNCERRDSSSAKQADDFVPPDGGCWAWVVCVTSFWANGTLFGILNIFGIVYVALKRQFEDSGDESLSFKLGKL